MKSIKSLCLLTVLAVLFPSTPLAAEDSPESTERSDIEGVVVDYNLEQPAALQEAFSLITGQFASPPSIVLQAGTEDVLFPPMQVENVRFGDLLAALEVLCDLRFKVLNPTPAEGESALIVVAPNTARRPGLPIGRALRSIETTVSGSATPLPTAEAVPRSGAEAADLLPLPAPGYESPSPNPPSIGPMPAASAIIPPSHTTQIPSSVPMLGEIPHVGGLFAGGGSTGALGGAATSGAGITWNPGTESGTTTQTYAIANLANAENRGQNFGEVMEAINQVWRTSRHEPLPDSGPAAPLLSLHEPSGLLIVRAPADLQSLAAQTISNLEASHQQRLEQEALSNRSASLQEEFRRERDHLEQLHQVTIERLKASHAAEVDKLERIVAELEAQLRALKSQASEGGN